jgi:hypothetical protein
MLLCTAENCIKDRLLCTAIKKLMGHYFSPVTKVQKIGGRVTYTKLFIGLLYATCLISIIVYKEKSDQKVDHLKCKICLVEVSVVTYSYIITFQNACLFYPFWSMI